jgi:hypothetical protein
VETAHDTNSTEAEETPLKKKLGRANYQAEPTAFDASKHLGIVLLSFSFQGRLSLVAFFVSAMPKRRFARQARLHAAVCIRTAFPMFP